MSTKEMSGRPADVSSIYNRDGRSPCQAAPPCGLTRRRPPCGLGNSPRCRTAYAAVSRYTAPRVSRRDVSRGTALDNQRRVGRHCALAHHSSPPNARAYGSDVDEPVLQSRSREPVLKVKTGPQGKKNGSRNPYPYKLRQFPQHRGLITQPRNLLFRFVN